MVAAACLVVHSPFGYTLRGIPGESEARMDCLGYNVWLHKYIAFLIAGGVASIAGILFAYHGFVSPAELSLVQSAEELLMVIVGGADTLLGPTLPGPNVVVFLRNFVSAYTGRWLLV